MANLRQNKPKYIQENIGKQIIRSIKQCGSGSTFFPSSYTTYGDIKAVSKSLELLINVEATVRQTNAFTKHLMY